MVKDGLLDDLKRFRRGWRRGRWRWEQQGFDLERASERQGVGVKALTRVEEEGSVMVFQDSGHQQRVYDVEGD